MRGPFSNPGPAALLFPLEAEAGELLLEAGAPPGAVHDLLLAACQGRVRLRVDVETQRVTLLAPSGAGGELGAVRHDHLDGVVVGMSIGFHGAVYLAKVDGPCGGCGSIAYCPASNKAVCNCHPATIGAFWP